MLMMPEITCHDAGMRNIDTTLLRAFLAVADSKGMTAAGSILNLTQAAVSQQIKRLEETFGHELIERRRSGLRLTDAGERLYAQAKRMMTINDEIWAEMVGRREQGNLRLGIPYDLVPAHLPAVLRTFAREYPHVLVSMDCRTSIELYHACQRGDLDLAIVEELTPGENAEVLADERLVWVGARGGEAHRLRPLPISIGGETCAFRMPMFRALESAGIPWRTVSEIGNLDAMSATVHADLAVTSLLTSTVPAGSEILSRSSGLPTLPVFAVSLYMAPRRPSAAADALAQVLKTGFRKAPAVKVQLKA